MGKEHGRRDLIKRGPSVRRCLLCACQIPSQARRRFAGFLKRIGRIDRQDGGTCVAATVFVTKHPKLTFTQRPPIMKRIHGFLPTATGLRLEHPDRLLGEGFPRANALAGRADRAVQHHV